MDGHTSEFANRLEFGSLLEAAQTMSESSSTHLGEAESSDPLIRRSTISLASGNAYNLRRRIPLTRQYSGRPHVPGEDSGSEQDECEDEIIEHDTIRRVEALQALGLLAQSNSLSTELDAHDLLRSNLRGMEAHQDALVQIERDRESLRQAVALQRELRVHQQNRRLREERHEYDTPAVNSEPDGSEDGRTTRGASTPRQHVAETDTIMRDVNSETQTRHLSSLDETAASPSPEIHTRAHLQSVRRWAPAERLQDYASTHPRRDSRNHNTSTTSPFRVPAVPTHTSQVLNPMAAQPPSMRNSWSESIHHEDIVNRVERALQEYRSARRALNANRTTTTTESGTASLPTLGEIHALRASRRQSGRSTTPEAQSLLNWEERWRRDDMVRQHASEQSRERRRRGPSHMPDEDASGLYASGPLFEGSSSNPRRDSLRTHSERLRAQERTRRLVERAKHDDPSVDSEHLKKAKSAVRHLALLRNPNCTPAQAWTNAAKLGLHNQSLHEVPKEALPLSVHDLPEPSICSWLEPGMIWSGTQSADGHEHAEDNRGNESARGSLTSGQTRSTLPPDSAEMRQRMLERRERSQERTRRILVNSMQVFEDADRSLSDMLEERLERRLERRRQAEDRMRSLHRESLDTLNSSLGRAEPARAKDQWEVKVTLHAVDWDQMTVSGTMTASQIGDAAMRIKDASMDSFFTGEIVDFARHGIDTLSSKERVSSSTSSYRNERQQDDWRVGGPEADLRHWAGIGPFKHEINKVIKSRNEEIQTLVHKATANETQHNTNIRSNSEGREITHLHTKPETRQTPVESSERSHAPRLSESEVADIQWNTMHNLLTDKQWLNTTLNQQGWILMRWKEVCFVSPGSDPNPEPTRPWVPNRSSSTMNPSSLTSTGFVDPLRDVSLYMNPQMRSTAERYGPSSVPAIYSTNAAEREEINGRPDSENNGTRQASWGLTISGFYYVALNRQSGEVEALYYDCTSAPYQRLKMKPALLSSMTSVGSSSDASVNVPEAGCSIDVDNDSSKSNCASFDIGGLRTNFSLVEFR